LEQLALKGLSQLSCSFFSFLPVCEGSLTFDGMISLEMKTFICQKYGS